MPCTQECTKSDHVTCTGAAAAAVAAAKLIRKHVGLEHIVTTQGTTIELNMSVKSFSRVLVLLTARRERKSVGTTKTSHVILKRATAYWIRILFSTEYDCRVE
jgi:hypothetical protein